MADIVSSVVTTIELIRACVNKYSEFCAFEGECATFRRSLSNVVDVLEDVKDELSKGNVTSENTKLQRPLSLLQTAVDEGGEVLKKCSANWTVLAFVFSKQLLGTLNKAKADVQEALRLLHFSSVRIQVATHRMMDSVSERLDELHRQINASSTRQNEVADLILQAETQQLSISEALVSMGVVSTVRDGADLLVELQREAETIRKAKVIYDQEILEAVLALTSPRDDDASTGAVAAPSVELSQSSETTSSTVLEYMICPISGEIMLDPVTVVESGITYDRESLCKSLLLYPDLEPVTGQRFDQPLHYIPNFVVRSMITAQHGDSYYHKFCDGNFKAEYAALWKDRLQTTPSNVVTGSSSLDAIGQGRESFSVITDSPTGVDAGTSLTEPTSATSGESGRFSSFTSTPSPPPPARPPLVVDLRDATGISHPPTNARISATVVKKPGTTFGLTIKRTRTGATQIGEISPGGLFASTLLKEGMKLVSINMTRIAGMELSDIIKFFDTAEGKVTVVADTDDDGGIAPAAGAFSTRTRVGTALQQQQQQRPRIPKPVNTTTGSTGTNCNLVTATVVKESLDQRLGISLKKDSADAPTVVTRVNPHGLLGKSVIKEGMHVVAINNVSANGSSLHELLAIMATALGAVTILGMDASTTLAAPPDRFRFSKRGGAAAAPPAEKARHITAVVKKTSIDQKLGISVKRLDSSGLTVVTKVAEDGAFAESELKEGMMVIKINNRDVSMMDIIDVLFLLKESVGMITILAETTSESQAPQPALASSVVSVTAATAVASDFRKKPGRRRFR